MRTNYVVVNLALFKLNQPCFCNSYYSINCAYSNPFTMEQAYEILAAVKVRYPSQTYAVMEQQSTYTECPPLIIPEPK